MINSPNQRVDFLGLDAAVINYGDYTGHTSYVVEDGEGNVVAFHYYAQNHNATSRLGSMGSLLAVAYDKANVWHEFSDSFEDYVSSQQDLGKDVRIVAYAFGTTEDDRRSYNAMLERDENDEGFYSLAMGVECPTQSRKWFNEYVGNGKQVFPSGKWNPILSGTKYFTTEDYARPRF